MRNGATEIFAGKFFRCLDDRHRFQTEFATKLLFKGRIARLIIGDGNLNNAAFACEPKANAKLSFAKHSRNAPLLPAPIHPDDRAGRPGAIVRLNNYSALICHDLRNILRACQPTERFISYFHPRNRWLCPNQFVDVFPDSLPSPLAYSGDHFWRVGAELCGSPDRLDSQTDAEIQI